MMFISETILEMNVYLDLRLDSVIYYFFVQKNKKIFKN
jgi:hypothetical protein